MKTPTEIYHELCDKHIETLDREKIVVMAMQAYHDQFCITPSERERQIAEAWRHYMNNCAVNQMNWEDFIQSDAFKAIPHAKTMPSREEANAIAHEISPGLGKKSYYIFLDGFMSCYDWLTDEFKSNENNLK